MIANRSVGLVQVLQSREQRFGSLVDVDFTQ
jgi:hypothetical protein